VLDLDAGVSASRAAGSDHAGAELERRAQHAPPHCLAGPRVQQTGAQHSGALDVQASADWSAEHIQDSHERVQAKLLRAFAEITGIRAEPAHVDAHRWLYAKTDKALGRSHLWKAERGIGVCGDWCIGHRVEDAFISGLELALAIVKR